MKRYVSISILIVAVLALTGFVAQRRQEKSAPSDALQVTASFYPLAHFAQQVGGDLVSVQNMTPTGSEPHDFDPSPRDVATLYQSKVFIYNGGGLEPWASRVLPDLEKTGEVIVNATQGMQLLAHDPHVWLSPRLAQQQVRAIEQALATTDASHAAMYAKNSDAYIAELEQLDAEFKTGISQCERREIVTSHAAFAYLAQDYGLTIVPIAGLSPDEEPSPARLAEISNFVREHGVTHIFFETLVSPALSQTIAHETGAHILVFNPLEGLTEEDIAQGKSYISVQRENLAAIRTALDCI